MAKKKIVMNEQPVHKVKKSVTKKSLPHILKLDDKPRRIKGDPIQRSIKDVKDLVNSIQKSENVEQQKATGISHSQQQQGRTPIPKEKLLRYSRGSGVDKDTIKTKVWKKRISKQERKIEYATEQAARAELLLTEDSGYLVPDEGEVTTQFTQSQIAASVDITSATKHFDLQLPFGSYRMRYSRNGRFLLLGGRRGHVAAFDWVTKKLFCEMNVMEEVFDVQWLHIETMFAVAQKNWVYIYDNQGIELHCLKNLHHVLRMEFLPYHFLLATSSEEGYLAWLDVSIGKIISRYNARLGRLNIMTQNPYNAVLCLGHSKGTVTMWSPNVREPLAKMLCHKHPLLAVAVDPAGMYMATSSVDRSLKLWDIRMLEGPLQHYNLRSPATQLSFSQRGLIAVGMGSVVEVYRDCIRSTAEKPYIRHQVGKTIGNLQFCPYEDVLGVATAGGFSSLLVPGSGEPNFDALESNPFQSKSQRREAEVKALLEKIQPDLITLDPSVIAEVDVPTLKDKVEAKKKLLYIKPPKIDYQHRKGGRRKGTVKAMQTKKILQEQAKKEFISTIKSVTNDGVVPQEQDSGKIKVKSSVLDRFKPKTKQ
ncbi:WD repeat-containing protein 46 [Schistocerca cancellata]|uniref:WD repeat-containing protein 46 n=1 Tax=Schistocerca cancellata TaxID=274614 RepID=UPI002117E6DE|nr:WD repeat-containing protein 46 [Schistocerca cancellata]